MFLIPLNQLESVELVVHALKAAGGEADCGQCPAHRVCMKQCLTIAGAIGNMIASGTLPGLEPESPSAQAPERDPEPPAGGAGHLKIIK